MLPCHQRAGGDLVPDDQHRAGRVDRELHGHAAGPGDGGDELAAAGAEIEMLQHGDLLGPPAAGQSRQHAHRLDRLGVAQGSADLVDRGDAFLVRFLQRPPGQHVRDDAEQQQDQQRGEADQAVDPVEGEEHREEDRRPHRLQRRRDRRARDEVAELVEIADRLGRLAGTFFQRGRDGGLQRRQVKAAGEDARHGLEGERADELDRAVERQRPDCDHEQHGQGVVAAADDDAILNLQHEHRHGQQQDVDAEAEEGGIGQPPGKAALQAANQDVGRLGRNLHADLRMGLAIRWRDRRLCRYGRF